MIRAFDLAIDGETVEVVSVTVTPGSVAWYRLFVKPQGAPGGPHSQHDVPSIEGAFRINGHHYKFTSR